MANQFLLHFNGSDTSTTFTNEGTEADDFTATGDAQLDTAQQKFGSASGLFDGSGDYIINGTNFTLNTGASGWTIECFVRFNTHSAFHTFFHLYPSATQNGVSLYKNTGASGLLKLGLSSDGTSNDIANDAAGSKSSWNTGQWYHIALVRDHSAGEYYVYVDGVLDITVSDSTPVDISDLRIRIGTNKATTIFMNGWMDEFRITDTCEYPGGTGFTVPTTEFTNDVPADWAAHYTFSETSGTTAHDSSGNGNDATVTGATFGGSVVFTGGTEYITLPETLDLELVGDVTFEIRFKMDAAASGQLGLISRTLAGGASAETFLVDINASNGNIDIHSDGTTSGNQGWTASSILSVDTWHELAVVIDRTAGTIKLYVDDVDTTLSSSSIGTDDAVAGDNTLIGADYGPANEFNGIIDFVSLYNTARSAAQVAADFANITDGEASLELGPLLITAEPGGLGAIEPEPLPLMTLLAGNTGMSATLPLKTISAATAVSDDTDGVSSLDLPLKTISAGSNLTTTTATAAITLPLFTSTGETETGVSGTASVSLPTLSLTARGNESAYLSLPLFTMSAAVKTGTISSTNVRLPAIRATSAGYPAGVYSGAMTLPLKSTSGSMGAGKVYTAEITLPRKRLTASTVRSASASAALELPILELTGAAWVAATAAAAIDLPALMLVSDGSNTVDLVYRTWVMNMRKGALTEYTNFDFNSFAEFNGQVLAAGSTGVHSLGTQDLDDASQIDAVFRTGISGFNTSYVKRIPKLYLGYRSDGNLLFKTLTTHDGPRVYRIPANGNESHHQRRVPIGRGPKSTYWQFELANEEGSDFSMNSILLYPQVLNRRNI